MQKTDNFRQVLLRRQRVGRAWGALFRFSNVFALFVLVLLALNIINNSFGLSAVEYTVDPSTLVPEGAPPLREADNATLGQVLLTAIANDQLKSGNIRVFIRDTLSNQQGTEFTQLPARDLFGGKIYPPELADTLVKDFTLEQQVQLLVDNLSAAQLYDFIDQQIIKTVVRETWQMFPSLLNRAEIEATVAEQYPQARLEFRSWVTLDFLRNPLTAEATTTGIRTALLGTVWVVSICILFAFPLGLGAAIYLEEYATDTWINRLIEVNIRNLAGVPSIVYGMLGLTVFVRAFGEFTSGAAFGIMDSNGRTVLSAGLTLGLVILPVIIITSQEAIRSVPNTIREASYGLGATKWQTIWRQVLPAAIPGILTGNILSFSRAIGETAPLIVIGASTFINVDPSSPFSKFTVLPIQIYQWTSKPDQDFRNAAAAGIIVLMVTLLLMNSLAIFLRNYYTKKLAG